MITISGSPKEIAALVVAIQERRSVKELSVTVDGKEVVSQVLSQLREVNCTQGRSCI